MLHVATRHAAGLREKPVNIWFIMIVVLVVVVGPTAFLIIHSPLRLWPPATWGGAPLHPLHSPLRYSNSLLHTVQLQYLGMPWDPLLFIRKKIWNRSFACAHSAAVSVGTSRTPGSASTRSVFFVLDMRYDPKAIDNIVGIFKHSDTVKYRKGVHPAHGNLIPLSEIVFNSLLSLCAYDSFSHA